MLALSSLSKYVRNTQPKTLSRLGVQSTKITQWQAACVVPKAYIHQQRGMRLVEIGEAQPVTETKYLPGQFFYHKEFQYTGVILDSWMAEVNEIHSDGTKTSTNCHYYHVLPDSSYKARQSSVRYGYAPHDSIVPYRIEKTKPRPIDHHFFDEFFKELPEPSSDGELYEPTKILKELHALNLKKLRYAQVYTRTTENVKVTAIPFFVKFNYFYYWQYHMCVQNVGTDDLRLTWWNKVVTDQKNGQYVEGGSGLDNESPVLTPADPSFEHEGHCALPTPSGKIHGTYSLQSTKGPSRLNTTSSMIKVLIPTTMLESQYSTELENAPDSSSPDKDT